MVKLPLKNHLLKDLPFNLKIKPYYTFKINMWIRGITCLRGIGKVFVYEY